ncbi:MAG: HAD family hydrolase [bacterium]
MKPAAPDSALRVVLFDADGVIQSQPPDWLQKLAAFAPDTKQAEEFVQAVFAAEAPCLLGLQDFPSALKQVLEHYRCQTPLSVVLQHWQQIEPAVDIIQATRDLQSNKLQIALATNQNSYRLAYMRNELGFAKLFDHIFCSCELGHRKPSIEFFKRCLLQLDLPAKQIMFIDDSADNVAAAQSIGIRAFQYHYSQGPAVLRNFLSG